MPREFPWHCHHCGKKGVYPTTIPKTTKMLYEDVLWDVSVPALPVWKCRICNDDESITVGEDADIMLRNQLGKNIGLLSIQEIEEGCDKIGISVENMLKLLSMTPVHAAYYANRFEELKKGCLQTRIEDDNMRTFLGYPPRKKP